MVSTKNLIAESANRGDLEQKYGKEAVNKAEQLAVAQLRAEKAKEQQGPGQLVESNGKNQIVGQGLGKESREYEEQSSANVSAAELKPEEVQERMLKLLPQILSGDIPVDAGSAFDVTDVITNQSGEALAAYLNSLKN